MISLTLMLSPSFSALSASRGPVSSYQELQDLLDTAHEGDVILISGSVDCSGGKALSTPVSVRLSSASGESAALSGLRLKDARVTFSNIHLNDSLAISGSSHVHLSHNVSVTGSSGSAGISFSGGGSLIVDSSSSVTGGSESPGVTINHHSGELYASLEGDVTGGSGYSGGPGVVISPLSSAGAVMISGTIRGGEGEAIGGHALNLYGLSGNAFITVDGDLQGGKGSIGGDGVQLVSAVDSVNVGIGGKIRGGSGDAYGGDAIILMDADGASAIHLSGEFSGGNALSSRAQPGTALQMVGNMTTMRTRVDDCLLEDGRYTGAVEPSTVQVTPLPSIPPSENEADPSGISASATPAPSGSDLPEADIPGEATPSEALPMLEEIAE